MHNATSRLNSVFGFLISVLGSVTFMCFLSTAMRSYVAPATVRSSSAVLKQIPAYAVGLQGKVDLASFTFDLHADLSSLFDWNTKELFLYLYAEYETKKNKVNQVTIWDKIVLRTDNHVINIKNGRMKYYLMDDGDGLRNHQNVTLVLAWNVIPNAGRMPFFAAPTVHHLTVPNDYTPGRAEL